MDAIQQRKNQETVANDYKKIEALGGPVPCPERRTAAIWEKFDENGKPREGAVPVTPRMNGTEARLDGFA